MNQHELPSIQVDDLANFNAAHILEALGGGSLSNKPYCVTCPLAFKEMESDVAGAAAMGKCLADFLASTEYSSDLGRGVSSINGRDKIAHLLRGVVVSTNTSHPIVNFQQDVVNEHLQDPPQRG